MSRYDDEVKQLTGWFRNRLRSMDILEMAEADYSKGTATLEGAYKELMTAAVLYWQKERSYELSYQQVNVAFFNAANQVGRLKLIPKHPRFRIGSKVVVRKVISANREVWVNVPGVIAKVIDDIYTVNLRIAMGDDSQPGRSSVSIERQKLDSVLTLIE